MAAHTKNNSNEDLNKFSEIDLAFHRIIYDASGKRQLMEMFESILYNMSMYWFHVGFTAAEFLEQFDELAELLVVMEKRKQKDAKEIMRRHIDHFSIVIKENIF